METNTERAFVMARMIEMGADLRPSGYIWADSDFQTPYWRVGGNVVVTRAGFDTDQCVVMRWHLMLRETRYQRLHMSQSRLRY